MNPESCSVQCGGRQFFTHAISTGNCKCCTDAEPVASTSLIVDTSMNIYTRNTATTCNACNAGYNLVGGQCVEITCTTKADANAWAAVGCVVTANQTGTTVSSLGTVSAATNYASCAITCPEDGQAFTVVAVEHTCTASDAATFQAAGCTIAGVATASTISDLGVVTPSAGYASCVVTCPTDGQAFKIVAVDCPVVAGG
jgi:hypothetical protein